VARRDTDRLLLQRRADTDVFFPHMVDVTASGQLVHGEEIRDGFRELREELGVDAPFDDLVRLGMRCEVLRVGSFVNCEFSYAFMLRDDRPLADYELDASEVGELIEADVNDVLYLAAGDVQSIPTTVVAARVGAQPVEGRLTMKDLVPRRDEYYLKVAVAATRVLAGDTRVAV
jgi:isopentenyldiphosphate isomerase